MPAAPKSSSRAGRRPGNQDTRGAILAAAREAFAAKGFAATSIRAIAAEAEVDAALVHHYFGSKQELFLATVALPVPLPDIFDRLLEPGIDGFGERLVGTVLAIWESDARPALAAGLRSIIADPAMTRTMREFATTELMGRVLAAMDVPPAEAELRAGLVASHLLGLFTARYLIELPAAVGPSAEALTAAVGPVLQRYLDGDFAHADDLIRTGSGEDAP
ncbi:TetR/AcrR family transcriptional regulator [Microlunatus ginsengisoli]|uniref:TetR family transcriptional regulator n=1 Tax=Microlunatus ginsengisoli TaxID=363863 RepID=A0ABP7ATG7_9ACTN